MQCLVCIKKSERKVAAELLGTGKFLAYDWLCDLFGFSHLVSFDIVHLKISLSFISTNI